MSNKTNEFENKRIGRMLQYARESHNLLQTDMVEATGLSKNHISAVERGVSKPSIEMLLGYCNRMKITPNDVLGYLEGEIIPELQQELSRMNQQQQKKVLEIIKLLNQ